MEKSPVKNDINISGTPNKLIELNYNQSGQVESFSQLRDIRPTSAGQRILLNGYNSGDITGGGEFISRMTDRADDGGSIASTNNGYYWLRISDEVNLHHYGITLSSRTSGILVDVSDKFNSAVRYAVLNGKVLKSPFVNERNEYGVNGMYLSKSIDIAGCTVLSGDFHFLVKANSFIPRIDLEGLPYVIFNQNGIYDSVGLVFSTAKGSQDIDRITIYNMDGANISKPLNGILNTFNGATVKYMAAMHFPGHAINFAVCYDSTLQDIRGLFSGNADQWGIKVGGYKPAVGSIGDESNALTIGSLVSHDCRDRAWLVQGSKIRLIRVHEEATLVTTIPTTPTTLDKRTTYGRMNSYFSSVGGSMGTCSIDPSKDSTLPHIFAIGSASTDVSEVYDPRGTVTVMSGDPAPWGGSINGIRSESLNIVEGARTTFQRINVTNFTGNDPDSKVLSGQINNILANTVSLSNCAINGTVDIVPIAITRYKECRFALNPKFAGSMVYLDGCTFTLPLVTADRFRGSITNGRLAGITLAGLDIDVRLSDISISGDYIQQARLTGVWLLNNINIDGLVTGWTVPSLAPWKGARTSNPRPDTSQPVDYIYTQDGWKVLTTRPA